MSTNSICFRRDIKKKYYVDTASYQEPLQKHAYSNVLKILPPKK